MQKFSKSLFFLLMIPLFAACPKFLFPFGGGDGGDTTPITKREKDVSGKISLALGGISEGMGDIMVEEPPQFLDYQNQAPDLFDMKFRNHTGSFIEGKGVALTPKTVGVGFIVPVVNGRSEPPVQVTVPPQILIQILMGEARWQILQEATVDEENKILPGSVSVTADAVGAVIRNRVHLINERNNPGLFSVNTRAYEADPPASYYQAVIEAESGSRFQFSPLDPATASHDDYLAAENRSQVPVELLLAYDQAVLSAADVFNEETEDPTGGAFAFYSPTETQYAALKDALALETQTLPSAGGMSDNSFPALAPLQVLILSELAPSQEDQNRPSFVFVRTRGEGQAAIVMP